MQRYRQKEPRLPYLREYNIRFKKFSQHRRKAVIEKQKSLKSEVRETSVNVLKAFEVSRLKLSNMKVIESKGDAALKSAYTIMVKLEHIRDMNCTYVPIRMMTRKDFIRSDTKRHLSDRVGMKIKRDMALVNHVSKYSVVTRDLKFYRCSVYDENIDEQCSADPSSLSFIGNY